MTDQEYMLRAIQLDQKRRRLDESQSDGRGSDRKRRKDHRGRLS